MHDHDRGAYQLFKEPLMKAVLMIFFLIMSGCYSNTAILGTPVNDLTLHENKSTELGRLHSSAEDLQALAQITENEVFAETGGLSEYRIGPLDVLEITSHVGSTENSSEVTVNNAGRISYSFMDDINVNGLTPSQVDRFLTTQLKRYIREPRIDVLVKEFNSKSAIALGEFVSVRASMSWGRGASGRIKLQGKTSLMDFIASAGGYTVDADIKNVRLTRRGKTYLINVYDIIEKGDERANVVVDNGDVVDIPSLPQFGERVYVMGEVNHQGIYPLKEAQNLLGAIALAGSVTPLAIEQNTLVVRSHDPNKKPLVMMADLKGLMRKADLSQNVRLEDGDIIYVPRMKIGDINDWIRNTMPFLNLLLYPGDVYRTYSGNNYIIGR